MKDKRKSVLTTLGNRDISQSPLKGLTRDVSLDSVNSIIEAYLDPVEEKKFGPQDEYKDKIDVEAVAN